MELITLDHWDDEWWERIKPVYFGAFPERARKNERIIRSLFARKLCFLHAGVSHSETVAMALTSVLEEANALLIDYFAVREDLRGQGIGSSFLDCLKAWAAEERQLDGIFIENEAERTPVNLRRMQFWQSNGFHLTEYVHNYKVVPETYQALTYPLHPQAKLPAKGETLFQHISQFHRKAYRGR